MKIIKSILTKNPCYKAGKKIAVKGGVLHSVGCPQPSAEVFVKNWNREDYDRACVHAFIDGKTGDVYQTLPWNHRGWHSGQGKKGSANDTHFGVEMCEPATIEYTGGSTFICNDYEDTKYVVKKTYESAVELFAKLCKEYNLNPLEKGVIVSHKEAHALGIASNHGDPEHLWKQLGMSYTMDTFRQAVKKEMEGEATTNVLHRVQVGAYSKLDNAKAQLEKVKKAGFDTYMVQVDGLYKIQVGAYSKIENARNALAELKKAGFEGFITTKGGNAVAKPKKSITEIAKEVIQGKWGNGAERKRRLEEAGYNYADVQRTVNELL